MAKQHAVPDTFTHHINKTQRTPAVERDAYGSSHLDGPHHSSGGSVQRMAHSTVLQFQRLCGNQATQHILRQPDHQPAVASTIQRYTEGSVTVGGKADQYRVSDDEKLLVHQPNKYGSHTMLAEAGHARIASQQLEAAKSVIRLKEVGSPVSVKQKSGAEASFVRIEPTNIHNKTSGTGSAGMEIWADCGKSARDVIGAGQGTGGGAPKAVYTNSQGKLAETIGSTTPAQFKREIVLAWIPDLEKKKGKPLLDKARLASFEAKRAQFLAEHRAAVTAHKDKAILDDIAAKYQYWDDQITDLVMDVYNQQLTAKEKEALDQKAGINSWAAPTVGEGYTISTGGAPKPGQERSTWNFHWAGVVMKSGGDTVVLENYATGVPEEQNTDWSYQMYGSAKAALTDPTKKGQTFHEQHRDEHAQHGETPTTMKVKPR